MMKRYIPLFIIFWISFQFSSCYYDIQEELHPGAFSQTCDTTDLTYSGMVTDILRSNCYGCHSEGSASANIVLDNFVGVKTVADNGRLAGSINHSTGFRPMPQNLQQLSDCDRTIIIKWIENGSTNN